MNRYEIAIEEYESSGDDEKHKLIYAYFGLAIYYSQVLEETFSIMLWTDRIFKKKVKSNEEVNEIIDAIENSKKTMGLFINEVKQTYSLPEQLIVSLKKILEKRNYIVHKYFKLEIQKFASDLGKREMLEYFCSFINNVEQIDEELNKYYSEYKFRLGITEEIIDKLVEELKNKELERELKIKNTK